MECHNSIALDKIRQFFFELDLILLPMIACVIIVLSVFVPFITAVYFSPFKDVDTDYYWDGEGPIKQLGTTVRGNKESLLQVMKEIGVDTMIWSFATGNCVTESWNGVLPADLPKEASNWVAAGMKYIISTGGANGIFRCDSDENFNEFIKRYNSNSLVGFDFDIENQLTTQEEIDSLVQRVKNAQSNFPNLRWSFTLATLGGDSNPNLGTVGQVVLRAIKNYNLTNYYINLMTMDYGPVNPYTCVVVDGHCDMGQSAVKAAQTLNSQFGIPYSQIEITPMIGGNDIDNERDPQQFFTVEDVKTVMSFVITNGLAGVHYWSFDRDIDCPPGNATPNCNTYGKGGNLGFTKAFLESLKGKRLLTTPTVSPVTPSNPSNVPAKPTEDNSFNLSPEMILSIALIIISFLVYNWGWK